MRNRFEECLSELKIRQLDCRIKSSKLLTVDSQFSHCKYANFTAEVVEAELEREHQEKHAKQKECRTFWQYTYTVTASMVTATDSI